MKKFRNNIKLSIGLIALSLISSCKPEIGNDVKDTNPNNVNFSKYIAIGNSLTSGFADGGLYLEGQKVAFPNLIANQLKDFGIGEFNSPLFSEAQSNGSGYLRLKALVNGQPVLENVSDKLAYTSAGVLAKYEGAEIQNLGIPGMRLDHSISPLVSAGNMYFSRLLPNTELGTKSYINFTTNRNHTFFSFWLGNNDALGYAMNGAVNDNPSGTTVLTSKANFQAVLTNFIAALTANKQKGVIATIPDVTAIPYFHTVTRKALLAATGGKATELYIATKSGPRTATDNDLFVLPFSTSGLLGVPNTAQIPYGFHPLNPIEDKYVLDANEVTEVKTRVAEYNQIIKSIANENGLAIADVHPFFNKIKNGYNYNGIGISAAFITGNAFSLDGIHLTPMGNAIVANLFIEAINNKYGTKLEKVDPAKYPAVKMP